MYVGFFFKNLILLLFSYYTRLPVLPYCKQAGAAKTVANLLVNVEILLRAYTFHLIFRMILKDFITDFYSGIG